MQQTLRPYVTAGVALVGSSIIVVTPVAAPPSGLADIQSRAVQLTAEDDSGGITIPGLDEIGPDLKQLSSNFLFAPGVGLQQLIANVAGLNTPEGGTPPTLGDELQIVMSALTLQQGSLSDDAFSTLHGDVIGHTAAGGLGQGLFTNPAILGLLLDPDTVAKILPLIDFLASPLSGVLIGMVSPFLAPGAQAIDVIEDLVSGNTSQALQDLLAVPTSPLTGSVLNLDFLAEPLNNAGFLPEGVSFTSVSFGLGGLLSTGSVGAGDYTVDASTDPATTVTSVGGSMLNDVGIGIDNPTLPITLDAHPIGPIGAIIGLQQAVASALGMAWSGKHVTQANAPLLGLQPFNDSGLKELFGGGGGDSGGGDSTAAVTNVLTDLLDGNWSAVSSDFLSSDVL